MQATAGGQPLYTSSESTVTAGFLRLPVVRYHELNRDSVTLKINNQHTHSQSHKVTKSQKLRLVHTHCPLGYLPATQPAVARTRCPS
ncbi:MAG: hypothetical protein ACK55Z_29330 [bacterium]